ncbi:hypothetical protein LZ32DRAFT_611563 [Colletotrichum eremochloae]|nr:hypothetical protein LZ32DRAFT_611563 [Colletotrichum eremochloae]
MADTDTARANKAYFNKLAAEYDVRYEKTTLQLEREVRKRKDFIGADWIADEDDDDNDGGEDSSENGAVQLSAADVKRVKLLDYACGTGLISRALAQFTTHCVGIDISENMVAVYNARAENQVSNRNGMSLCLVCFVPPFPPSLVCTRNIHTQTHRLTHAHTHTHKLEKGEEEEEKEERESEGKKKRFCGADHHYHHANSVHDSER